MNSYFDFIYEKALCKVTSDTMKKCCYGCEISQPSQTHPDCLKEFWNQDDDENQLDMYFNNMLNAVDKTVILQAREELVKITNIFQKWLTS